MFDSSGKNDDGRGGGDGGCAESSQVLMIRAEEKLAVKLFSSGTKTV